MMEPKWLWLWLWLSVLLLLLGRCRWCSIEACWEDERIALLQLKPFFNRYHLLNSWVEEVNGSDCCHWKGVECNSSTRRVIKLDLDQWERFMSPDFYLIKVKYWYLNASLFLPFKELKCLYLSQNDIAGFIESEGFAKLSLALGNLEILDLTENYLNDTILSSLSQLSSLKHLYLGGNSFTGSSHANGFQRLSRFANLETLDLSSNFLNNSILFHIASLLSLKTLNLGGNSLEGTVDIYELNSLSNLKHLDLSNNRIESFRSSNQGNETQLRLEELKLDGNLFRNNTFFFPRGLSSLKSLSMWGNSLQGSIDITGLINLINLKELDLSENKIERLQSFKDSEMQLNLTHLEELGLSRNLISDNIFASLRAFPNLKYLYLSYNQLKGSIDMKDLGVFTNLEELYMRNTNEFEAREEFHAWSNAEEMILNGSFHSNNLLQSIGVLSSLKILSLSNFGLTGSLPNQGWCDLRNLEALDISGNALEGILPYCLGNLTSLRELDISNNKFTGNLTPLANLTSLRFVSLSKNHFQISMSLIPLTNLPNLMFLLADENKMVMEPNSFHTSMPKFQLNYISFQSA